jgi:hypothetical protein
MTVQACSACTDLRAGEISLARFEGLLRLLAATEEDIMEQKLREEARGRRGRGAAEEVDDLEIKAV